MTTAHRPTWKAAVGKVNEGGWSAGGAKSSGVSALDAPAHTKLKFRHGPQLESSLLASEKAERQAALQRSLLELEAAELSAPKKHKFQRTLDPKLEREAELKLLKHTAEVDDVNIRAKYDDSDAGDDRGGSSSEKEDAEESDLDDDDDDDSDLDDSDDDDDEAALQAELAKIRAEREDARRRVEEEEDAVEQERQEEAAVLGNPLLNEGIASGRLKRRWNDDIVFRNQAKGEPVIKKRFINDTVRNDFHRRFLHKFMK